MAKRYYYVKLDENFLDDVNIRRLRSIAGGLEYVICYLKLILRTIRTGGLIEIIEGADMVDEIALLINEPIKNIKFTLKYLEKYGLIQIHEMILSVNYSMENVGSEADSTRRVKDYRRRQRALQCNAKCNEVVTINRTREETEKEQQQCLIETFGLQKTVEALSHEGHDQAAINHALLLLNAAHNVKRPGAWLRRAVEEGWTDPEAERKEAERQENEAITAAAREAMEAERKEMDSEPITNDFLKKALKQHEKEEL